MTGVLDEEGRLVEVESEVKTELAKLDGEIDAAALRVKAIGEEIKNGARHAGAVGAEFDAAALREERRDLEDRLEVLRPKREGVNARLVAAGAPIRDLAVERRGDYIEAAKAEARELQPLVDDAVQALERVLEKHAQVRARWLHAWRGVDATPYTIVGERLGGMVPVDVRLLERSAVDIRDPADVVNLHSRATGPTATTLVKAALAALRNGVTGIPAGLAFDVYQQGKAGMYRDLTTGHLRQVTRIQISGGNGWIASAEVVAAVMPDEHGLVRWRWEQPLPLGFDDPLEVLTPDDVEAGRKIRSDGTVDYDPHDDRTPVAIRHEDDVKHVLRELAPGQDEPSWT